MPASLRTAKIAIRFSPGQWRGLLDHLGADRTRFKGLCMAVVERGWHICWLKPDEWKELNRRFALQQTSSSKIAPPANLISGIDRTKAVEYGHGRNQSESVNKSGLIMAGLALCREGEVFPLPLELAHAAGFGQAELDHGCTASDIISQKLDSVVDPYAYQALHELGGLSAKDFTRLVRANWFDASSALHLHIDLDEHLFKDIAPLKMALLMLQAVGAQEPLSSDSLGRLPMGLVLALLENPIWPGPKNQPFWNSRGLPTENRVKQVHATRAMLQSANLLEFSNGEFSLTNMGRALIKQGRKSEIYARLLESRLRRGAGFKGIPGKIAPRFHRAMAYHLYRLAMSPITEMHTKRLSDWLALPIWLYGLHPQNGATDFENILEERFYSPLTEFGLLTRQPPLPGQGSGRHTAYRMTPLFHQVFEFDI